MSTNNNNNQQNDPLYQQARRAAQQQVNNIDPLAANPNPNNSSNQPPRQVQLNDSNIMSNRSSSPNASPANSTNMQQQTTLKPAPTVPPIALQTVLNNKVTNKNVSLNSTKINTNGGIYPLPINTNFVPGGIIYKPSSLVTSKLSSSSTDESTSEGVEDKSEDGMVYLSEYSNNSNVADKNKPNSSPKNTNTSSSRARSKSRGLSIDTKDNLKGEGKRVQDVIHKALSADVMLHKYALLYAQQQQQSQSSPNTPKVGQRLPSLSGKFCVSFFFISCQRSSLFGTYCLYLIAFIHHIY